MRPCTASPREATDAASSAASTSRPSGWSSARPPQGASAARARCAERCPPRIASGTRTPQQVAVIGAGTVGLSTAWFLQESGVEVTVYERHEAGAGASWGNAGWLTPALTAPLPEPSVLRYGLRA